MDVQVRVFEDFDLGGGYALTEGVHTLQVEDLPNYETVILDGRLFFPLRIKDLDALNQQFNEQIYNLYLSDLAVPADERIIGEFFIDISSGGISASEYTCTFDANLLQNDGDKIEAFFCGVFATSGDDKQVSLLLDDQPLFDTGVKSAGEGNWELILRLIRIDSDTVKASAVFRNDVDVETDYVEVTGLDFTSVLDLTLEISSDVDAENTAKFGYVKFIRAFNPPPPDTTAPSVPTGLALTVLGTDAIQVDWDASTD
jgi:hypothetical protein